MRKISLWAAGIASLFAAVAVAVALDSRPEGAKPAPGPTTSRESDSGRLVVHEWGTFTNFAGADGVSLEFRPLADHELPDFVFNRERQATSPFTKFRLRAPIRMETPVTYFYTDRPRDVEVQVRFPRGLLTEFYPPVQSMGPAFQFDKASPLKDSFLNWGKVRLIPQATFSVMQIPGPDGHFQSPKLPAVKGDDHYGLARNTDSAIVQAADQWGMPHYEKFLFYRGLGNFPLPTTVEALPGGRFMVKNSGADPIHGLFLVQISGGRLRFLEAADLPAGQSLHLEIPTGDSTVDQLAQRLKRALVATGLYDKEAQAMVETWRSSWFGEEGTRLFYLLPERLTNTLLPLSVTPAPNEQVRVLVGRIEIMTPRAQTQLKAAIQSAGTCLNMAGEPIRSELHALGRFAEPALERLARNTTDEPLRQSVTKLLTDVRRMRSPDL